MKKVMILVSIMISFAVLNCSKSESAAAAAAATSSGGSGLDGTGVFTYSGTVTQITNITANGTGGNQQTFTPSGGVPATAKFYIIYVTCNMNNGSATSVGSGEFSLDLAVDDNTANTTNAQSGLIRMGCPVPTAAGSIAHTQMFLVPTYATALSFDHRGASSISFYNTGSNIATGGSSISVAIAGFVY